MIAAIYARKSTGQTGIADEEKSVARQVERARAFATARGWMVAPTEIYRDDGISGAEFVRRPGFQALVHALTPAPRFQVLIVMEVSRLGRESLETGYWLKQLHEAGVRIWSYLTGAEVSLESFEGRALYAVTGIVADGERVAAQRRTYDKMRQKAEAGHVTGGVVYGYQNVPVLGPTGKRDHVTRTIVEAEAAVIRRIFTLAAEGFGAARIAKQLNTDGVPGPVPRRIGRSRSWSASSIYAMLTRPLYRGELVWNRTKKRNTWGKKAVTRRPADDWIRREAPALRIVDAPLWDAVQARLRGTRDAYLRTTSGQLWGRPSSGLESQYLLTGLGVHGVCGGGLLVQSRPSGDRRRFVYRCSYHAYRGTAVCRDGLLLPMGPTDRDVLAALEAQVLTPAVVEAVVQAAVRQARPTGDTVVSRRVALTAELAVLDQELARYAEAVATAPDVRALVEALRTRERRRRALAGELATLDRVEAVGTATAPELADLVRARLVDWQGLTTRHVTQSRQLLKKLLVGRIAFTVEPDGVVVGRGEASIGAILTSSKTGVSPTGFEPVLPD